MPKVHVTRQPCAHTLAKLFARLVPVLGTWCARTSKDSPSGLGDFVGGGGRRARKQPSMGHTLAELAPHVKLENYLDDTSSVYYSRPPSKLLDRIWQPCSGQGCGCGRARTDAHRRACARVALGLSIRMHRIACAYARGTQPAPCTHLACAASVRLTPKLLHTGRTPILWRVS